MACLGNTWDELGVLTKLTLPSTLINSSDVAISLITIFILGYSDTDDLAAASIGIAYINMIWYFVEGFLTAQDSLSYEAFVAVHKRELNIEGVSEFDGSSSLSSSAVVATHRLTSQRDGTDEDEDVRFSESRSLIGTRAQSSSNKNDMRAPGARGIRYWTYVSSLLFLPICATCVCVCLLSFLIIPNYLNVDAQLAARASSYVITSIPSLLLLYACRVLQKHIQAFGIMTPSVTSGAVSVLVHVLVSYVAVFPLGGGYIGAAAAFSFTRTATLIVLLYHILNHPHLDVSWYLFGREITVIRTYNYFRKIMRGLTLRIRRFREVVAPDSSLQRYFSVFGFSSRSGDSDATSSRSTGARRDGSSDADEDETDEVGIGLIDLADRDSSNLPINSSKASRRNLVGAEPESSRRGSRVGQNNRKTGAQRLERMRNFSAPASATDSLQLASGVRALSVFVNNSGPLARNTLRFLVLGLSGGVILGLEVWSFDVGTILASYIGPVTLSAHTILLMWTIFLYVLMPFAVSIAASVRVHSLINARNAAGAELTANTVLLLAFVIACINAGLTYGGKDILGYLFSSDKYTRGRVAALAPTAALFQFVNALEACAQGVLRGCGQQGLLVGLNVLSLWVFGFPAGLVLTFYTRPTAGIYGIWYGFTLGVGMQTAVLLWLVWTFDWERAVRRATARDREDPLNLASNAEQDEDDEAEGFLDRSGADNRDRRGYHKGKAASSFSELSVPRPGSRAVGSFLCNRAASAPDFVDDLGDDERIGISELYSPKASFGIV